MSAAKTLLSAVIIAKNEESSLPDCLKSISFCNEIVLVDSGSTDRTRQIAQKAGARVFERTFDDFAAQKNFAVSMASERWVLSIDADERVSQELKEEILLLMREGPSESVAYRMPRTNFIFGKHFREWGGAQDAPIRLFLKEKARFEGLVHEGLRVEGEVGRFKNPLFHYSTKDAKDYFRKLNLYTDLEASLLSVSASRATVPAAKPLARFAHTYFVKGGVLNGREGFIFSVLSGYYEFVRYAKFNERGASKGSNY